MTHVQTMGPQMARILVSQTGLKKKKKKKREVLEFYVSI